MKSLAALGCTALAAALVAYGCGSSSTIDNGAGGGASGTGGKTGGGTGGGVVIITNVGGQNGTAGMNGGMGGMNGAGGRIMPPPMDAGNGMCTTGQMCTIAGDTCPGMCNRNGVAGTRTCTCGNNGRYNCAACITPDAGAPPPMDAGPRPDAGTPCANNVMNNRACMLGVSVTCVRNVGGGNMQTCTCEGVPDAGADAAVQARYVCM